MGELSVLSWGKLAVFETRDFLNILRSIKSFFKYIKLL